MATNQIPVSSTGFPEELIAAIAIEAANSADRVALFLADLGIRGTPDKPLSLPREFLLELAAALRLLHWEVQGFPFHIEAGLPEAREAIRGAFRHASEPKTSSSDLLVGVLRLFMQRFAWAGQRDLGVDMALDELNDDAALDALAEFLWASRHAGSEMGSPQS